MSERIAVVTTSYPSPGDDVSGHFVRSEVDELAAAGHSVTVFCPGNGVVPGDDETAAPGVRVERLGAAGVFGWPGALSKLRRDPLAALELPRFVGRARARLRSGNFDRVIAHWLVGSGWPIALASRAPLEVVVHGSDARLLARLGPLRGHVLSTLERRGCKLRLVAPHLAPLLQTGTNSEWLRQARVAPLPISLPLLPQREVVRRELGLAPGAFLAVLVGRLIPSKRLDVALRNAPFPDGAQVVVIGSGPLLTPLKRNFPNVHFTGQLPREEALRWLKAADVALSASVEEGAPTALREARALGTPVWTAEFGSAAAWAASDPQVTVLPSLT